MVCSSARATRLWTACWFAQSVRLWGQANVRTRPELERGMRTGRAPKAHVPPLHEVDARPVASRPREAPIPRHERGTERFRERDVGAIVSREVRSQLPDPVQQRSMRIATDRESAQVLDRARA